MYKKKYYYTFRYRFNLIIWGIYVALIINMTNVDFKIIRLFEMIIFMINLTNFKLNLYLCRTCLLNNKIMWHLCVRWRIYEKRQVFNKCDYTCVINFETKKIIIIKNKKHLFYFFLKTMLYKPSEVV